MDTGVRETVCSKCVHSQVCAHKHDYLDMVKRLEDVFYSVPEKERVGVVFKDPGCKYINKGIDVCTFMRREMTNPTGLKTHEQEILEMRDEAMKNIGIGEAIKR